MTRGKGNPRCEECEGHGICHGPQGCYVCECVRGKPNRALLQHLAGLDIGDFATWDDADRARKGLPPFIYGGHDESS